MGTYTQLVEEQRAFFNTNVTKAYDFRMEQLEKLEAALRQNDTKILEALQKDLNKPAFESYAMEVGFMIDYIGYIKQNLEAWMTPKVVDSSFFPGTSSTLYAEPYGVMLNIAPFNYPIMLTICPLIDAIMTGNTSIIKPSELAPNVSRVLAEMLGETFDRAYIAVVEGEVEATQALLAERYDYIFFTGSARIGRVVMEAASKHLTPVTLELGGKAPAIVTKDADLKDAAQKIMWGKLINAGQTCVAPDYTLVDESVKDTFIMHVQEAIQEFYGTANILENPDYGRIVTARHTERLADLMAQTKGEVVTGGLVDVAARFVEPTVVANVTWDDVLMAEELFAPIMPIISFNGEAFDQEVIAPVKASEKPLALYLFAQDEDIQRKVINELSFGGGTINGVIVHGLNPELPFGGVGNSGLGHYHGRSSFDQFSHQKSMVTLNETAPLSMMYPPYTAEKVAQLKAQH